MQFVSTPDCVYSLWFELPGNEIVDAFSYWDLLDGRCVDRLEGVMDKLLVPQAGDQADEVTNSFK